MNEFFAKLCRDMGKEEEEVEKEVDEFFPKVSRDMRKEEKEEDVEKEVEKEKEEEEEKEKEEEVEKHSAVSHCLRQAESDNTHRHPQPFPPYSSPAPL